MLCLYECLYITCIRCTQMTEEGGGLRNWSCRWLLAIMRVLEIEPGALEKQLVLLSDALAQESGEPVYT